MTGVAHVPAAGQAAEQAIVSLDHVSKSFAGMAALRGLSLDIRRGEFLTLLGPSGCGKTTTLRLINGFEVPDSGTVSIAGRVVNDTPPYHRNVNTVFQSYALFPHLTVEDNVAYGLVVARRPKQEITRRVGEILERVALKEKARRFPRELSGGQMQRVALARALVNEPQVLLLDEPLGALDAKLRRAMHIELRRMHRDLGITFVCVTHDQEEALVMSDRIALMKDGGISQIGTPREIYERPQTRFVADFIGGCNFLPARLDGDGVMRFSGGEVLEAPAGARPGKVVAAVRASKLIVERQGVAPFAAQVTDVAYVGDRCRLILRHGGSTEVVAECEPGQAADKGLVPGASVSFSFSPADMIVLKEQEGAAS